MARYTSMPRRRSRASGLGPSPGCELAESLFELTVHVCLRFVGDCGLGHQDQVAAHNLDALLAPEGLPQQPLRAVPNYCVADLPPYGEAQAEDIKAVVPSYQQEEAPVDSSSAVEDLPVLGSGLESLPALEPGTRWAHSPLDRESLPAFGPTSLEDQTTALGPHPHQKAVGPLALAVVRLERPLHKLTAFVGGRPVLRSSGLTLRENI